MMEQSMMVDKSMLPPIQDEPQKVYEEITDKQDHVFFIEKVVDWNKRIAHYPQAKKNIYLQAFKERDKALMILVEDSKANGWAESVSSKKYGMTCETKFIGNQPWMRAEAPLDYDALTCLRLVGNMDMRLKYEKNLSIGRIID